MFGKILHKVKVILRWISIWITRIVKFITLDIWRMDHNDFKKGTGRLVKDLKVILLTLNTFSSQKIGFQATALSYQTTMSIVPFLAIAIYLTSGIGLSDKLSAFLYANISNERLIQSLVKAADTILETASSGIFGLISMLTFLWIVIWMMISVRRVFNNVWKVEKETRFMRMVGVVFGILILSPFVLIILFSGSIVYTHVLDLLVPGDTEITASIKSFLGWAVFAVVSIAVLTAMYKYIPGTKVLGRHASRAAVYAGIVFTMIQYLYLETQVMVTKISAVYGVLAALPLFMIWLNIGWTVILYGAELSYAFQNVDKHHVSIEEIDRMNQEAVREKMQQRTDNSDKKQI